MDSMYRRDFPELFRLVDEPSVPVLYIPKMREFGIERPGDESFQLIHYCPITGIKLPPSVRDTYFDEMERMGVSVFDPGYAEKLPEEFFEEEWWRRRGL